MNKKLLAATNDDKSAESVDKSTCFSCWCIGHKRDDLLNEWDIEKNGHLKPTEVTSRSNKLVWWKCKLGHSWKATPNNRTSQHQGCPYCAGRRALEGFNDLTTKNPGIAKEWGYERNGDLKPPDVTPGSNRVVWWMCPAGREYKARIFNRTFYGTGCPKCGNSYQMMVNARTGSKHNNCPVCAKKIIVEGINDFASEQPR